MKRTSLGTLLVTVSAICGSGRALADDLLGLYVAASIGEARAVAEDSEFDYRFDRHHVAWELAAGIRPIAPLGVEFAYVDFGNPSGERSIGGGGGISKVGQKAVTLFGLGYLPIPIPFLDVYGKIGGARLRTTITEISPLPACPAGSMFCGPTTFSNSDSSVHFAYGAGVQGKVGSLAIRAEYERFRVSGGDPDLVALGITWSF